MSDTDSTKKSKSRRRLAGLDARELMAQGVKTEPMSDEPSVESFPTIPGYETRGFVGRGGMGSVLRARQESLDRDVAIKLLANDLDSDGMFLERLGREARAMAKLRHPNIVAVYDFVPLDSEQAAIVMEMIDGDSMRPLLREHRVGLPLDLALKIGTQIVEALAAAHDNGIVHRDIKPENVLIDQDGTAKVGDFGLALPLGEESSRYTVSGTTVGTLGYMAPEQLDNRDVDARADVYSLGVILYEMLTGVRPQGNVDPPRKRRPEIPREVSDAVMKALRQAPEERFDSARQLLAVLKPKEAVSRRRSWLPLIAGLVSVLGAAAVFLVPFGDFSNEKQPWRDLLSEVDLDRRQIAGDWTFEEKGIASDDNISILQMPVVDPGTSYDVRYSFTRKYGNNYSVALFFRTQQGLGALEFDSWGVEALSGVQIIDGSDLKSGDSFEYSTVDREFHQFTLEVRPNTLRVKDGDGEVLHVYDISDSELTISDPWGWTSDPDSDFIAIGSWRSRTVFHEVLWRPAN